ncbi:DUF3106 domain-containing protein [Acinetobacter portensis]|uniref:DUF3106 domain-containing protein n=2 Tax=Acinetobacter TaxID=469 RepID=A0A6L6GH42_9GAMM|nr:MULTISPECIES: DUF3106 domain-containing protein [Acinetobacter]MCK7608932.1 DUF3106 domain-containing protein [Acinetobacter portensis]MCK7639746.1 DUF3106 domain-containing protein [Acinetobacter portensis]MDY6459169.1 DUF3106 domain-containing protein [Acinetobacter faecalis]MDY6462696.1 DUF3106 domain-containing protein [Acinetobacter faecalis]MDY6486860.1 DUF3106 domain-containing protein [Acinetobacter faecalis]
MVAKKRLVLTFCILGFLQTSFAGFDRFWILSKDANTQIGDTWDSMSDEEQQALIKRYQSLNKELPESARNSLQQRMDWFSQLPDAEKQQMREAWQKMSTQERKELSQRLQKAEPENRALIREEYIQKYKTIYNN